MPSPSGRASTGQLMRVAFTEGQIVKAGDLARPRSTRARSRCMLTQAQGQMAKDQALLKNAQVDLERYRTLLAQDSIAKQQGRYAGGAGPPVRGTLQADQGAIDNAKLQLTYARVTAPIGGRVGLRQIDPGNIVHASDANGLVVITELSADLRAVPDSRGQRAAGDAAARHGRGRSSSTPGIVISKSEARDRQSSLTIDNQIDTTTGTVKLKAEFPNENLALFPNQFVNVRMLGADAARCDAGAVGGDPARRARDVRLRRQGRSNRSP